MSDEEKDLRIYKRFSRLTLDFKSRIFLTGHVSKCLIRGIA